MSILLVFFSSVKFRCILLFLSIILFIFYPFSVSFTLIVSQSVFLFISLLIFCHFPLDFTLLFYSSFYFLFSLSIFFLIFRQFSVNFVLFFLLCSISCLHNFSSFPPFFLNFCHIYSKCHFYLSHFTTFHFFYFSSSFYAVLPSFPDSRFLLFLFYPLLFSLYLYRSLFIFFTSPFPFLSFPSSPPSFLTWQHFIYLYLIYFLLFLTSLPIAF